MPQIGLEALYQSNEKLSRNEKEKMNIDVPARMPVLFLGHGSPLNALAKNDYTELLTKLGKSLPVPKAILCISAHWTTQGTWVTHMKKPKTIHDFFGFPDELFAIQYPAPGNPELAEKICQEIAEAKIELDDSHWGLDHGTWSVLRHVYPEPKIPVVQLSLDMTKSASFHYSMGERLGKLRDQGVLIIGSGNIVHNLRLLEWDTNALPRPWALEFDQWVKQKINVRDFGSLTRDMNQVESERLSVPTAEHYYPLLYTIGAASQEDIVKHVYEGIQNASISMRCIQFG